MKKLLHSSKVSHKELTKNTDSQQKFSKKMLLASSHICLATSNKTTQQLMESLVMEFLYNFYRNDSMHVS